MLTSILDHKNRRLCPVEQVKKGERPFQKLMKKYRSRET
jgi:hypothetical protein